MTSGTDRQKPEHRILQLRTSGEGLSEGSRKPLAQLDHTQSRGSKESPWSPPGGPPAPQQRGWPPLLPGSQEQPSKVVSSLPGELSPDRRPRRTHHTGVEKEGLQPESSVSLSHLQRWPMAGLLSLALLQTLPPGWAPTLHQPPAREQNRGCGVLSATSR